MKTWQKLRRSPQLWKQYFVRERVIKAIRSFFDSRGFHEVETPFLISHPPAESYVDVFETTLFDRYRHSVKAYLSTSPEVALKKLMVAGLGNCYALTKSFRNMETQSKVHNPEFTILEWYRVGVDYTAIMRDCEDLLLWIHRAVNKTHKTYMTYREKKIELAAAWERLTVAEAFEKWSGIDRHTLFDREKLKKIASKKGYKVDQKTTWEQVYNQILLNEIEPELGRGRPMILYEFPAKMAALSKTKKDDQRVAERFEFYIEGLEMGDCYTELTDWREQEKRFQSELKELKRLGKTTYQFDQDFIEALKVGLPECSGIAVGVDRLVMLFAGVTDIAETLFFPGREMFGK